MRDMTDLKKYTDEDLLRELVRRNGLVDAPTSRTMHLHEVLLGIGSGNHCYITFTDWDDVAALATCEKYRDAYAECDRIGTQAVRDLEAKLEHAKKGLRKILRTSDRNSAWDIAIATLEKLKGEKHD